jgi:hypothetical protein
MTNSKTVSRYILYIFSYKKKKEGNMALSKTRFNSLSLREKCCWPVSDYLTTF